MLYVTERAVLALRPEGLTVVEIAPGADLERDILHRCDFELRIDPNLSTMSAHYFLPAAGNLTLEPMAHHPRLSALAHRHTTNRNGVHR
ncbi:hypothetical protein BCA37_31000 (plasmid) [Mycobacterium sp. djl-10]|nr:hypothetical protein BCA37_31000 [Mycobacterium sp. djl-10]